ncbi:MAG TPA: hypothetical protein VF175_00975, partial [Lacipirellula sp.]
MEKLTIWLTPIWILAVGVTAGALVLAALWGLTYLINRKAALAISGAISEGVLRPISYVVVALAALAVLASPAMPWSDVIASLQRLPEVQPIQGEVEVPPRTKDFEIAAGFRSSELQA